MPLRPTSLVESPAGLLYHQLLNTVLIDPHILAFSYLVRVSNFLSIIFEVEAYAFTFVSACLHAIIHGHFPQLLTICI